MRAGVIGSSGGSALAGAAQCLAQAGLPLDLVVVADRPCGLLAWAQTAGYRATSIAYGDADAFGQACHAIFAAEGVDAVLLYYTRRIGSTLFDRIAVYNVHPSLLPAFPGLGAVEHAQRCGARVIGATLHAVTDAIDQGPIVAQISTALPHAASAREPAKISYLQKVYLTLVWYELLVLYGMRQDLPNHEIRINGHPPHALNAAPSITSPALLRSFLEMQRRECCAVIGPGDAR